jgi:small-conductance mechanosensitive channel
MTNTTNPLLTRQYLLLAGGQILPVISRLNRTHFWEAVNHLYDVLHPGDLALLVLISYASVPAFHVIFTWIGSRYVLPFEDSNLYQLAVHISQIAQLAMLVYLMDCVCVILTALGFTFSHLNNMTRVFAKVLYIAWAAQRISIFKRYCLCRAVTGSSNKLGKAYLVDRLADGLLFVCTSLFLLDILDVEMGVGITSMFAFGSASTLLFGLASRDLAAMIVNGFTLSTSDRVQEGDYVEFGDKTSGRIETIGWMQTVIRNYDEKLEIVPNSQLGMQRVKNLSRVSKCQVKQRLRFQYKDADKLPKILDDILEEIKASCPAAITNGSRPFRAVWTDYKEDYLSVLVDTHYDLPCMGKKYWNNRQEVMLAIHRAVRKNGVEFVTTFYPQNSSIMN